MNDWDPDLDSTEEYFRRIEMMADSVEEGVDTFDQNVADAVWEEVDASRMVIYTHECLAVLHYAQTQPEEWRHLAGDSDEWEKIIQAMAFDIIRNDLWEEVHRRNLDDA